MKLLIILTNLILAIALVSCSKDSGNVIEPPETTSVSALPTDDWAKNFDLSSGRRNIEIQLSDGTMWPARISVPATEPAEKMPFVLALHWTGPVETYEVYMQCLVESSLRRLDAIVLGLSSNLGNWGGPPERDRILKLITLVKKHWPIDVGKIVLTGYSAGGTSTWNYAFEEPTVFNAAIPMAGLYKGYGRMPIPICIIHGDQDELYDINVAKFTIDEAISAGSTIKLITATSLSHFVPCDYFTQLQASADWLLEEVW
ncbi:MAG: hypothetical protein OEQ53_03590 [Saprospiraceae bacterium]|nr:hypothetical protein [Saprospiraceae bacterium]